VYRSYLLRTTDTSPIIILLGLGCHFLTAGGQVARHRRVDGVARKVRQQVCTAFLSWRPPLLRAGYGWLKVVSQVFACRRFGVTHPYLGGLNEQKVKLFSRGEALFDPIFHLTFAASTSIQP
jgi:hypothetical protein